MPILFIDEGFGSQDRTGQELLIEILQAIKTDFDKILVVTHIEEIKEAFPTRIEVEKTDAGSNFTVI
jgi:exonuclease SbcC